MLLNITLSSEYPLWTSILCLLLGLGFSYLIYQKKDSNKEISKALLITLFALRSIYLSIIAFLIISPFVLSLDPNYEKPILILAQDRSQSIANLTDTSEIKGILSVENEFIEKCKDDFDIHYFNFGEDVSIGELDAPFNQRITDYSALFHEVRDRFNKRNVAMMIMASDGLYNRGSNPIYSMDYLPFPLYTLAIGDTSSQKDAYIEGIDHNELAFFGNTFDVDVTIAAQLLNGRKTAINILKNGKKVATENVNINSTNFVDTYKLSLQADEVGMNRFEVVLSQVDDEVSTSNNSRFFYIEVLKGQQEILLLSSSPHPDVNALMLAINKSKHFNAESKLFKDFDGNTKRYNLLILNQLPSDDRGGVGMDFSRIDLPKMYVIGKKTSMNNFNQLEAGVSFERFKRQYNESTSAINQDFKVFSLNEEMKKLMLDFPPLTCPFADYRLSGTMNTLSYQKIGKVVSEYPQIGFMEGKSQKSAYIFGEGMWRWRLYDYKVNKSNELFDEFVQSMIQYLGLKEDKSRFRIEVEASFFEDEEVIIQAEYYNKAYELTNDQDVTLTLKNSDGQVFEYDFLAFNQKYKTNIGRLESGDYTWKATIDDGVETFEKRGSFNIKKLQLEYSSVKADYTYLVNLSNKFGGRSLHHSEMNELANELLNDEKFKPIVHYTKTMKELISFKWLFVVLLLLFGTEWFMRKWIGLI